MDKNRQFTISSKRLMDHSMELMALILSHEEICQWLAPYEREKMGKDYAADYYRDYFEERVSYLLISTAILLRTTDNRKLTNESVMKDDPVQIELGKIQVRGQWEDIDNFRIVLNFIVHAKEVIPGRERSHFKDPLGDLDKNVPQVSDGDLLISGKLNRQPAIMVLNLRAFCDMVFRIVEGMR